MYPNLVVVSFLIYISSRFEKEIIKLGGYFMFGWVCTPIFWWLSFPSFFVSFGMWAYLGFGDSGFWQFILFLIIFFSRFQYFNLHFDSLKLCFTNLVLEIHDNLSLIFLSSLEISNLIYFTHFRLSPIIMGQFKSRFVQYAKI